MNNYKRFVEKNRIRANAINQGNASFIMNGYNSTVIKNDTREIFAAVVNQQEKDTAYIYTGLDDNLEIGSLWETKGLHLLVAEEIVVIKDVKWHKYNAYLCNVEVEGIWGRFIGPEEKYINLTLQQSAILTSEQKPVLILPSDTFAFGDKIIIKNRAWLIQEVDNITTDGISYYSLKPTTMPKNKTVEKDEDRNITLDDSIKEIADNTYSVIPNTAIVVNTNKGYFEYNNASLKILRHTTDLVEFLIPIGVEEVEIKTKERNNNVITKKYIIR